MEDKLIYCYLYLLIILSSGHGKPILSTPLGKFAVLGKTYSIGCEFDTSTSFALTKDGNVEVEVERRTCFNIRSVKNYLLQCNTSGDLTVTIQAKEVTHYLDNTTWQCSDKISQSLPFQLRVYTPPTNGPLTGIKDGNRPFKFGDVVTYMCTVIGGFPRPRLSWNCIVPIASKKSIYDDKTSRETLEIQINISKSYHYNYNCKCVAEHKAWSGPQQNSSIPVLIKTVPIIGKNNRNLYTAGPGMPVTITVDYYAYPGNTSVVVNKKDYTAIESENRTTTIYAKSNVVFNTQGQRYQYEGESVYWTLGMFNETDYGPYKMVLQNEEGVTYFTFDIKSQGPPSEPYNVNVSDITSYGFTATFSPGFDGGYIQTFCISHWPLNDYKRRRTVKSSRISIKVRGLFSLTDYQFTLYAENKKGRSLASHKDPLVARTTIGEGEGSHKLIHIVYFVSSVCLLLILTAFISAIVFCYKQKTFTPEVPPYIPPRATLNTDRAVYTDRAIFRRSQGLPDSETVERMTSRCKRIRRAIKVPPILAVFRKSRYLPDCNVISDVHEAISRSTSNIPNGNNQTSSRASDEQQQVRQSATTFPRELNYPHIEIRHQGPRTSPALHRTRTNYSQIYFNDRVSLSVSSLVIKQFNRSTCLKFTNKIENGNGECVKETTTRPQSRKQSKATNGSSTQRENRAPGGALQRSPKQ